MWLLWSACDGLFPPDEEPTSSVPTETSTDPVPAERPLAGGLSIDKVKLYQGTETVIYDGASSLAGQPPVIAGRDAAARVFVDLDANFAVRDLTAILTLDGESQEVTITVEEDSKPALFATTFNFTIPGEQITPTTEWSLRIVEKRPNGPGGGDPADVEWTGTVDVEVIDPLEIVILPIEYQGDGSDRLPDTSLTQIARIRDLVTAIYPASEVTVRVEDPYPWPDPVEALDGNAWGDLLLQIVLERQYANESPNTYYYGLFSPADDLFQYCDQGCILGLSFLAYTTDIPGLRASIGVGFSGDIAAETLVHEVGHAHGREHAPCGLFGQTSDPNYPYEEGATGAWGWDATTEEWLDPDEYKDMMSYCQPLWVSDYTWVALADRGLDLSSGFRAAPVERATFRAGADGVLRPGPALQAPATGGATATLKVRDASGASRGVRSAQFFPYSHVPGGLYVLDGALPTGWTAEL